MEYTAEQKKALDQILLEIAASSPMRDSTDSDDRGRPFSQKTIYRKNRDGSWNTLAFVTDIKRSRAPDATDVRLVLPISDEQVQMLSSTGTPASQMINLAFADYLRPDDGVIKLFIAASTRPTATRQNGQHIIDLGSIDLSLTRNAYLSFVCKALEGLSDPQKGADMLGISADAYRTQLADKESRLARKVKEIVAQSGFARSDKKLAALVQAADAEGHKEYAALLGEAVAQLPEEVGTPGMATKVGKARERKGSSPAQ